MWRSSASLLRATSGRLVSITNRTSTSTNTSTVIPGTIRESATLSHIPQSVSPIPPSSLTSSGNILNSIPSSILSLQRSDNSPLAYPFIHAIDLKHADDDENEVVEIDNALIRQGDVLMVSLTAQSLIREADRKKLMIGYEGEEWQASSTLKKRRLKMNKHKYRKRRKRDRQRSK